MTPSTPLTAIDLFCGAGGFSSGLLQAGFDIVCAVDAWPVAVETYGLNFAHPVLNADVSELTAARFWKRLGRDPVPIDLIVGGPPCQGFSIQRRGDIKYKTWDGRPSASDLYQLLVHARTYGASRCFLVFPHDAFVARHLGMSSTGCDTWLFAVDIRRLSEDVPRLLKAMGVVPDAGPTPSP